MPVMAIGLAEGTVVVRFAKNVTTANSTSRITDFMTTAERVELLSQLHRQAAELGAIYARCQANCALSLGMKVSIARDALNDAIDEFQPDKPEVPQLDFPRRKI
jgi:hypothetical protein